jgi:hypothetical protein
MDYVLIIIAFAGGMSGGVSQQHISGFGTMAQCETAAANVRAQLFPTPSKVIAVCAAISIRGAR